MWHKREVQEEWREEGLAPFDELILSWNATRPTHGEFCFYVSCKTSSWSPWLLYARWGSGTQASFQQQTERVKVYQDVLEVLNGEKATGFQVKIVPHGAAALEQVRSLHVYTDSEHSPGNKSLACCASLSQSSRTLSDHAAACDVNSAPLLLLRRSCATFPKIRRLIQSTLPTNAGTTPLTFLAIGSLMWLKLPLF